MKNTVVITGIGIVSPIGIGKDAFWTSLQENVSGIKPVTLFDTAAIKSKLGGEITNFTPEDILDKKGLRNMDRATKLLLCAGQLALNDAGLNITDANSTSCGISVGTTLGSLWSISEFDKSALRDGPHYVNPAEFPNTVINSPPSQLAIRMKIKGPCATIASGFTSSLDAVKYGMDLIKEGRAETVLAGGVEEFCEQTYLGFYTMKFLAGIKGKEVSSPYDKKRNGIILGEGSAILILESEAAAKKRNARIYARISGFGTSFHPYVLEKYEPTGAGLKDAMASAITDAELKPDKIDYISSAANSSKEADKIESDAIRSVFKEQASTIPVSSIKSSIGETFSASGVLNTAAAIGAIEREFLPATLNYSEKDPECPLDCVPNKSRQAKIKHILVNSFGPGGTNSCVVVSKHA